MEDYISRNKALESVKRTAGDYAAAFSEIRKEPKANVKPIVYAHWEDCSNGWMCSNCEKDNTYNKPFCPNCGATMVNSYNKKGI